MMDKIYKREVLTALQSNLMKLAQVLIEKNDSNKPLSSEDKEIFSLYNEKFKKLISLLPSDYYFDESDPHFVEEILSLSEELKYVITYQINTK